MAKIIIEYSLTKDSKIPNYIDDGGYYPLGNTLIGFCNNRSKLPERVKQISRTELINRIKALPIEIIETRSMTTTEKETFAADWETIKQRE